MPAALGIGLVGTTADFVSWRQPNPLSYRVRIRENLRNQAPIGEVRLSYDSQLRLTALTDATGRQTTFAYGRSNSPLLITAITDPFGRTASLVYNDSGHLFSITDVLGLTSNFAYDSSGLVNSMTTPYGTTQFAYGQNPANLYRWLQITDPLGLN